MSLIVTDEATLRRLVAEEFKVALKPALAALAHQAAEQAQELPELMTSKEVADLLRVDARTLRRMVHAADVPAPISIGDRTQRWPRSTIESFLRDRTRESER